MKSLFTNEAIVAVMEQRGVTRKSAMKWLNRNHPDAPKGKAATAPALEPVHSGAEQGVPANPANAAIITEKPEPKKIVAKRNKAALAKAAESLQHKGITSEGLASRTLGTKLYNVAGRPTKAQLILVYGPKGPAMTWPQRAEAGVSAEQFQDALKAKLAAETK